MIEMIKFNHQNNDRHQQVVAINMNIQLFHRPVLDTDKNSEWGGGKQNNMQTTLAPVSQVLLMDG